MPPLQPQGLYKRDRCDSRGRRAVRGVRRGRDAARLTPGILPRGCSGAGGDGYPRSHRGCREARGKPPQDVGDYAECAAVTERRTDPLSPAARDTLTQLCKRQRAERSLIKRRRWTGEELCLRARSLRHPLLVKICRNGAFLMYCCYM